jgi:hypothetical protein
MSSATGTYTRRRHLADGGLLDAPPFFAADTSVRARGLEFGHDGLLQLLDDGEEHVVQAQEQARQPLVSDAFADQAGDSVAPPEEGRDEADRVDDEEVYVESLN